MQILSKINKFLKDHTDPKDYYNQEDLANGEEIEIDDPPDWVWKAYEKWERRLGHRPYNLIKEFRGNTYIYEVEHGMGHQGEAPIIKWTQRKK